MKKYYCSVCNYDAKQKSNYDKHLKTKSKYGHVKGAEEAAKLRANLLAGQSTLEGFLGQQRQQHRQVNDSLTLTSKSKDWDC